MMNIKNKLYRTSKLKNSHVTFCFRLFVHLFFNILIRNSALLDGGRETGKLFRHDFDNHCNCNADNNPSS